MGNNIYRISLFSLAFSFALFSPIRISERPKLKEFFIIWNVGQGDLLTYIGTQECWFFDLGGSYNLPAKNLKFIKNLCSQKRNEIFISHFDRDHIQFYKSIFQILNINHVFIPHKNVKTHTAKNFLNYLFKNNIPNSLMTQGDIQMGKKAKLLCLWPTKINFKTNDENSQSLVLLLKSKINILLTGDLPGKVENFLPKDINIHILKVAHHGSKNSTGSKYLKKWQPKTCLISVGRKNLYGHPHSKLLNKLQGAHCAPLRTDILGTVIFEL